MSGWGGGYVTDVSYMPGYYAFQAPTWLNTACLVCGFEPLDLTQGAPLAYLELGCGFGFNAAALAAGNPSWRVFAVDFNPAHIASARALAAEAGVGNVTFIEADLATFADDPRAMALPEFDIVTAHGVWSWVPEPVRRGIVRLLRAKVRAGGFVNVTYNTLPGWQAAVGLQRLVREAGLRLGTRSDRQVLAGIEIAQALDAAEAAHVAGSPFAHEMLEHWGKSPTEYLAHEVMNSAWRPCFHMDVAQDMAEAKLDYIGSAMPVENFPELMLTPAQREVQARFDDPMMRELVKDMCLIRGLRSDLYVRGARRLDPAARDAAIGDIMVGMSGAKGELALGIDVPSGRAELDAAFWAPVGAALAKAPSRIRDLLALPDVAGRQHNPPEVAAMLVGTYQAVAMAGPPPDDRGGAIRFNIAAARRLSRAELLPRALALTGAGIGTGVPGPVLELQVCARLSAGRPPDPALWAREMAPLSPADEHVRLTEIVARVIEQKPPVWRSLGILAADV